MDNRKQNVQKTKNESQHKKIQADLRHRGRNQPENPPDTARQSRIDMLCMPVGKSVYIHRRSHQGH